MKKYIKSMAAAVLFIMPLAVSAQTNTVQYQPVQQGQQYQPVQQAQQPVQQVQQTQQSVVSSVVTSNTDPQKNANLSDEELSNQYKLQMDVVNNEIKTLKAQAKLYKTDTDKLAEITGQLNQKKQELKDLKGKKKIVDTSIKAQKAQKKAQEKAEKAEKKAKEAAEKAAALRK